MRIRINYALIVTVSGKTDHFVTFQIMVPRCSVRFTLHYDEVQFAIAHTVPELRESKYEHPKNMF